MANGKDAEIRTGEDRFLLSRRDFGKFAGAGLGVLLLGFLAPARGRAQAEAASVLGDMKGLIAAYVEITPDNTVWLVTPEAEMGQGVESALPAILAEEMEADWDKVATRLSGAGEYYINPGKNMQATGRSMAVRGYFELLRQVGATARDMLRQAAAERWGIAIDRCKAEKSHLVNLDTGARLRFADVADAASRLPIPEKVELKPRERFSIIGTSFPRKDVVAKVTGRAVFGVDVDLPGMLVATIAQPPAFGGKLLRFDEKAALAVHGVVAALPISDGLAVVAESYWQARQGIEAANPEFDSGPNGDLSTDDIMADLASGLDEAGIVAREDGDISALARSAKRLSGEYSVPYLAHTTMEPMSCTVHVRDDACEVWAPSQGPIRLRDDLAAVLRMDPAQITVHRTYLGGGFGRRWQTDFAVQAAEISRAVKRPVKLIWSREEDVQHDYYRPAFAMRFAAGLDRKGRLEALDIKVSGASIGEWGKAPRPGVLDRLAVSGLGDSHYAIPNYRVESVKKAGVVPIGTWRSVGHSQNGFFLESIIDEAAHAAGQDPLKFRRAMLDHHPRWRPVLDEIAKLSGWGKPLPKGRARGIAVAESYGSYMAEVVEISVENDTDLRIHNIYCVIDCGFAVNPGNVERQVESAVIYGLTAALTGKITISGGAVEQSNFHDYPALMMEETPPIKVKILQNAKTLDAKEIGGVGEPALPPIAPALANAVFAATGKRIRSLPLADHGFTLA